jgi:hypothetical protein
MRLDRNRQRRRVRQFLSAYEMAICKTDSRRVTFTGTIGLILQSAIELKLGWNFFAISIGVLLKGKRRGGGQASFTKLIRRSYDEHALPPDRVKNAIGYAAGTSP